MTNTLTIKIIFFPRCENFRLNFEFDFLDKMALISVINLNCLYNSLSANVLRKKATLHVIELFIKNY